jgi:hypothetical protein
MLGFYRTTTAGQTTGLHVLEGFSGFQEYSPDYKFQRFSIVFQVFRNFPIVENKELLSTFNLASPQSRLKNFVYTGIYGHIECQVTILSG